VKSESDSTSINKVEKAKTEIAVKK
jgi:hypothetical protein